MPSGSWGSFSPGSLSTYIGSGRSFHHHLYTCVLKGLLQVKMDEASAERSGDLQNEGLLCWHEGFRTHSRTGDTRVECWEGPLVQMRR